MMIDRTPRWAGGSDLAIAWPGGIALVAGGVGLDVAERLWNTVRVDSQLGVFLKTLAATSGAGFLGLPDFAVAVRDGDRWQVAVRGSAELSFTGPSGMETLSGAGVTTWAEKSLDAARALCLALSSSNGDEGPLFDGVGLASEIHVGEVSKSPEAPTPATHVSAAMRHAEADLSLPAAAEVDVRDLAETLSEDDVHQDDAESAATAVKTPGPAEHNPYRSLWESSIAIDVEAAAVRDSEGDTPVLRAQLPSDQMDGETVSDPAGEEVDLILPGATWEQVLSKACHRGHLNPPERSTCFVCDSPVAGPARLETRPQLGWLRVEGGETVPLTGTIVAGRNPSSSALRSPAPPRLLALPYPHVSSTHLAIRLEGWRVLVQDLGSSNGTYLRRHGKPPVRLPETSYPLVPGDLIDLGKGLFLHLERIP